nr:endonuclease/exonuclease/phosphatase family protein [Virgibacillus natechei]
MINQVNDYTHPVIIMGDFNMKSGSGGWKKMTSEFQDVWHLAGDGKGSTYPSLQPRSRLDYIFVSPSVKVLEANVVTSIPKASDSLPLKAHLSI